MVKFTAIGREIAPKVIICFLLLAFSMVPVWGQTTHRSRAAINAETRRSKRDAARIEADYKDSHLNTTHYTYKKGAVGRKKVRVTETPVDYISDKEINALDRVELKKMSKKKLLPKQKKNKKLITI